jgi:hypothetical protein
LTKLYRDDPKTKAFKSLASQKNTQDWTTATLTFTQTRATSLFERLNSGFQFLQIVDRFIYVTFALLFFFIWRHDLLLCKVKNSDTNPSQCRRCLQA